MTAVSAYKVSGLFGNKRYCGEIWLLNINKRGPIFLYKSAAIVKDRYSSRCVCGCVCVCVYIYIYIYISYTRRESHRQTDRQTSKLTVRETGRQTYKQTNIYTSQRDKQTSQYIRMSACPASKYFATLIIPVTNRINVLHSANSSGSGTSIFLPRDPPPAPEYPEAHASFVL